jgi:PAS domain S-box-containing protein
MLLIGGAAWWSATRSAETFRWVDHTHEVLYRLEATLTNLLVLQSSSRGYALTAHEDLLQTYDSDEAAARENLRSLRRLIADNPAQLQQLDRLDPLVAHVIGLFRGRIALRRSGGLEAVIQPRANTTGPATMSLILAGFHQMEVVERRLLAERSAAAQSEQRQAVLVFGLGSLVATVLVVAAGLVVRRDFYQRVKAEAERDRFFSLSLDLLCISSVDGYFKRVSPAVTDVLGWTMAEFLARPYIEMVHPDDRPATLREVERQIATGERVLQFENRYRHKDGSWRVLSWRSVPQPDGLMYAIARDVTEQKQHEAQILRLNTDLQQRAALLEAANKELEAFSYSVSHDLRAPLRHVDGFANLLQKHSVAGLDDQGRRYLATISDSARQMGRLIDDLLSFSRMGRATLQPKEVDDHDALIATVIREGRWEQADRPIEWHVGPLPRVHADPALLQQVWANLLDNAVKYSAKVAAPRIEIGVRSDPAAGEQVFFVRDNGAGFDMRYAGKLFGVFQRLHGPTEFEGTGIGLANVRRIVLRHGGRTWAEGAPGRGATFYFSLPVTPASAAA